MKIRKYLIAFILLILCIPLVSKADTWLDDPSYRDTSWFDASTYDATTDYTLDSSEKLAGLLYLVNEEGYTFVDKYIHLHGNTGNAVYGEYYGCRTNNCFIDLSAHDWVPIKKAFKGTFVTYDTSGQGYVLIINGDEKKYFIEDDIGRECRQYGNYGYCTVSAIATFVSNIKVNQPSHGSIQVYSIVQDDNLVGINKMEGSIMVSVDEGYYLDTIEVIDVNNEKTEATLIGENQFRYYMPASPITINPVIKKVEDSTGCKVISGTGKNLGDEIACGDEHFYVLSNDNNNVRMLAKYNLHTGISIYREKIEREEGDTRNDIQYCDDLAAERHGTVKRDNFYNTPGYCFYTVKLPNYKVVQTEDSKSAHWDEDLNYLYPQVGDVYMMSNSSGRIEYTGPEVQIGDTNFYNFNFDIDNPYARVDDYERNPGTGATLFLYLYKERLNNYGAQVSDISLLPLDELDGIIHQISGNYLPLNDWGENVTVVQQGSTYSNYTTEIHFGDLKPYIPEKYKWLYSTTYWNGTVFRTSSPMTYMNKYHVFTAEQGKLCGAGFEYCAPTTTLGCGLRPVVTISASSLIYSISTETDDYSDIEVVSTSPAEEEITFRLSINQGRKLRSLTIRTDNNEEVTFTEGELINNPDGTISINSNKFTMPFSNVTIIVNTDPYLKAEVIKKDNCEITLTKAEGLEAGENVIVTVTCNDGYEFKSLEVKDENNNTVSYISFRNTYSFNMPSSNVTVGGECSLITYSAEVIKEENGNVTLSKETEIVPNEEVTATIECNERYEFDSLEVTDKDNNKVILTDNKFSMPTSNVKVSGICKKEDEEPVTPDEPVVPDKEEPVVPSETDTDTPITSDNIIIYVVLLIISIISLVLVTKKLLTKKK